MAKKNFHIDIDLNQNELLKARLENSVTPPANPVRGQIYFDTALNQIGVCIDALAPEWLYGGDITEVMGSGPINAVVNNNGVAIISINNATQLADGAMSKEDKTKLDNATSNNISSTIVQRDGNGDFSANIITATTVTGLDTPINPTDAVNKAYVDASSYGLDVKQSVRTISSTSITLSGIGQTISGVTIANNDRVLVFGQIPASQDGIYIAKASTWTRATDFLSGASVANAFTFVEEGDFADTGWICTNDRGFDVVGTDDLIFVQFSAAGTITVGDALLKTGNNIDVLFDNDTIKTDVNNKLTIGDNTSRVAQKVVTLGSAIGPLTLTHNWNTKNVTITAYDSVTMEEVGIYKKADNVNYITVEASGTNKTILIVITGNIAQAL